MQSKIAFTGGRDYTDDVTVYTVLNVLQPDYVLVGDADGLDRLVRTFCKRLAIPFTKFVADWETHGKSAGPMRNSKLLEEAELLIAFPGGRGTANCIQQAQEQGIPVLEVLL